MTRRWPLGLFLFMLGSCLPAHACPSQTGGTCDPRDPKCPTDYYCALAEVCTRHCQQTSDCWVSAANGCVSSTLPGQRLPDGGSADEGPTPDGFCADSKRMACLDGYCQREGCLDGGCDYDLYGPSPFKGNRSTGPNQ